MRNRVTGETYVDPLFDPLTTDKKSAFGHTLSQIALQKGLRLQSSAVISIDWAQMDFGHITLDTPLLTGSFRGYSDWAYRPAPPNSTITRVGFVQSRSMLITAEMESAHHSLSELAAHALDSQVQYTHVHEQKVSANGETIASPIIRMLAIDKPDIIMFRPSEDDELYAIAPNTAAWEAATDFRDTLNDLTFDQPMRLQPDDIARIGLAD